MVLKKGDNDTKVMLVERLFLKKTNKLIVNCPKDIGILQKQPKEN